MVPHKIDITINNITKTVEVDDKGYSNFPKPQEFGLDGFAKGTRISILHHSFKVENLMREHLSHTITKDCKEASMQYWSFADFRDKK